MNELVVDYKNNYVPFIIKGKNVRYKLNDKEIYMDDFSFESGSVIGVHFANKKSDKMMFSELFSGMFPFDGQIYLNDIELNKVVDDSLIGMNYLDDEIFDLTLKENITLNLAGDYQTIFDDVELNNDLIRYNLSENSILNNDCVDEITKKKILIARALYRKRKIIVLCETLDGLPQHLIDSILDRLHKQYQNSIIFIISKNEKILQNCSLNLNIY